MAKTIQIDWRETLTGEMLLLNIIGRILYTYPDKEERTWLQTLINDDVFSEVPFASEQEEIKVGLKLLQKWAKNGLDDEQFERMKADYMRLFIGPEKLKAAPWESVYLNKDRMTFQEQTLDVRYWYRRFGLEAEKIHKEPDDHIGLELIFMSHLATLAVQALEQQDQAHFNELMEAQRQFFKKHLRAWALRWCDLVENNARTDFYQGQAHLTHGAILALSDVLNIQKDEDDSK